MVDQKREIFGARTPYAGVGELCGTHSEKLVELMWAEVGVWGPVRRMS